MSDKFKFDVVIGNPPYQEESKGDSSSSTPIYHHFMEEAYKVARRVSFITPARFLFNAGQTPKQWNKKMLEDEHLKVEYYERDSSKVFANTNIVGGVAVTYRDADENFGATGLFITTPELNSIAHKVKSADKIGNLSNIAYARTSYKLSNDLHVEHPEARNLLSEGHAYDVSTNIFDSINFIFFDSKPDDANDYLRIYGIQNNERVYKWVKANYIEQHPNLYKFKVFQGKSNGASGVLGETPARMITPPIVMPPEVGHTQTFMSFGAFDTEHEAVSTAKYIRTKFARVLLGILKVTQDNPVNTWTYIPLQDFTFASDIDWSQPICKIDQQLYKKYGLDETEIDFIESHVKEMG
ncbi:MAG: Eco57I restriction-modification methylase domain-containing protein [Negativicutes bacterium]|nr:Eco57I restriction-modification methylase domain-containing protein [Negativicutes bacterium]